MNFPLCGSAALFVWLLSGIPVAEADSKQFSAADLFSQSETRHVTLSENREQLILQRGRLYEDDGPAAGYSYEPNTEKLLPGVWIKKTLIIPNPKTQAATLLIGRGGDLSVTLNGKPVTLKPLGKQGNYWEAYQVPPESLKAGENDLVISGTGSVWIARDEDYATGSLTRKTHPNRSAKSTDGGKTWNDTQLGPDGTLDGEYYVRLFLDQFQPEGTIQTRVIDLGNLAGKPIGPPVKKLGPVRITIPRVLPPETEIGIRVRTGSTPVPAEKTWSNWLNLSALETTLTQTSGRYLQLEFRPTTENPLRSPELHGVEISTEVTRPEDWTQDLKILTMQNPKIVRSSIPFAYESFTVPELARLRREFHLDKIVEGAKTEFEIATKLAGWSATHWRKMHLNEAYPAWNSFEILKPHPDGTPIGGFCQQHSLVFLQACQSFGITARAVSIGPGKLVKQFRSGHETSEIWSNDYQKWIYIDGDKGWYAVDQKTRTPLSLLELRDRQLSAVAGESPAPVEIVKVADIGFEWGGLEKWPALMEVRLVPRNNFFSQQWPLPLNQGMRGWFWTGHYVWTDEAMPARLLYSERISKRENMEWTLNQSHLTFEAIAPNRIRVHVDTVTPDFKTFLQSTDSKPEQPTPDTFEWTLHPGKNRLQVVCQNKAGRTGIPSTVVIEVGN